MSFYADHERILARINPASLGPPLEMRPNIDSELTETLSRIADRINRGEMPIRMRCCRGFKRAGSEKILVILREMLRTKGYDVIEAVHCPDAYISKSGDSWSEMDVTVDKTPKVLT